MLILSYICFIAVSSGSVTINDDSSVQILAEEAIAMENIDAQVCGNFSTSKIDEHA